MGKANEYSGGTLCVSIPADTKHIIISETEKNVGYHQLIINGETTSVDIVIPLEIAGAIKDMLEKGEVEKEIPKKRFFDRFKKTK